MLITSNAKLEIKNAFRRVAPRLMSCHTILALASHVTESPNLENLHK